MEIDNFNYNKAISQLMIFRRYMADNNARRKDLIENFLILLSPFAPCIAEELWSCISNDSQNKSIFDCNWPKYQDNMLHDNQLTIAVQVNGKVTDESEIREVVIFAKKNVSVKLAKDGTFQEEILLDAGEKTFRIKAIDVYQNEKVETITVSR